MTHEYKPVPVNCRQRLAAEGKAYPRSSCASCGQFSPNWRECESKLARPVPPPPALGGEPEVVAEVVNKYGDPEAFALRDLLRRTDIDKLKIGTELIDRAHLAPLQAEIERLDDELDERGQWDTAQLKVIHGLNDDVARLKARCNELESGLRIIATAGTKTRAPDLRLKAKQTLIRALSKPAGSEKV